MRHVLRPTPSRMPKAGLAAGMVIAMFATTAWAGDPNGPTGMPKPSSTYRFVFDLSAVPPGPDDIDPGLRQVAQLVDTYAAYGVGTGHRKFVVVIHGGKVDLGLTAAAYGARNGGQGNANIALMRSLANRGVRFILSEPSSPLEKIDRRDVQPFVEIGPNANITFLDLETGGYVYTSTKSLANE